MIKTFFHGRHTRRYVFSSAKLKHHGLFRFKVHTKIVSNQNASIRISHIRHIEIKREEENNKINIIKTMNQFLSMEIKR